MTRRQRSQDSVLVSCHATTNVAQFRQLRPGPQQNEIRTLPDSTGRSSVKKHGALLSRALKNESRSLVPTRQPKSMNYHGFGSVPELPPRFAASLRRSHNRE